MKDLCLVVILLATIFAAGCSEGTPTLPHGLSVSDTLTGIKIIATDNPEFEYRDYYAEQTTMGSIHGGEWHVRITYVVKKSRDESTGVKSHEFAFEGANKSLDIVFYKEDGKTIKKEAYRLGVPAGKATPSPAVTASATPSPSASLFPSPSARFSPNPDDKSPLR